MFQTQKKGEPKLTNAARFWGALLVFLLIYGSVEVSAHDELEIHIRLLIPFVIAVVFFFFGKNPFAWIWDFRWRR